MLDFILPFLAMAKSKQASLCSSGLTKTLDWKKRESLLSKFLTRKHTYHQDILSFCSFVYNNYLLDSILPFLAMAKSKQASLCSSGLTKTFLCYSVEKVLLSKTNPAFWEMNGICGLDVG